MKKILVTLLMTGLLASCGTNNGATTAAPATQGAFGSQTTIATQSEAMTQGTTQSSTPATTEGIKTSKGELAPSFKETLKTDVLVLGGGGAGITSALTASENGKKVILTEKIGFLGGATIISGGIIPAANTTHQKEAGIVDSDDLFARDIFRPSSYSVRKDLVYTITENANAVIEWLEGQGVKMSLITNNLFYGQSNYRMHIAEGGGNGLTTKLIKNLESDSNIQIMLNSPAIELAVKDGEVIGAFIKKDNKDVILIEAENTVLATSGFAANKEMLAKYIPEMVNAYPLVAPGATGEGILWGVNLGAEIANMKAYQGHGVYSEKFGASVDLNILYRGGILVNKDGFRFTNEHKGYSELSPEVLAQPTGKVYMVFNQKNADETALLKDYNEKGILVKADTIKALADQLEVDAAHFEASVADFENGIVKGQDSLNRSLFPADFKGPFYAIEITADIRHTQGGLVTDVVGHVLKQDGTLIKGLYAAGGVMEGFSDTAGPGYMSGNGLLQAFVFGRLAGKEAALSTRDAAKLATMEFEKDPVETPAKPGETPEPTDFKNGVYEGTGQGNGGDIVASVEIVAGKINSIEITKQTETEAMYQSAKEPLIKAILEANSTQVDTISGATQSSNGIIDAVKDALEKAK